MNKEEQFIQNRFLDLANIAYDRNIYTVSDFLNLNEINIFNNVINNLPPVNFTLTGGNNYAERKIVIFSPFDIAYDFISPITIIKIAPINPQFADKLTHRDYLGAILNLGINRNKIGDIFIDNNIAYVYCINDISNYIIENLNKIKHTMIKCDIIDDDVEIKPILKDIKGTMGNVRLDSLIALAFNTSRNSIISYIESGKVFVNGKLITSNGYSPKNGDIISVRGKGRFCYNNTLGQTKKGRNLVSISLYI